MKIRLLLPLCSALLFSPLAWADNEIGFIEKFALAPDREAVLGQLIPGSEDYYFYSALHFQNTAQKEKLATTMKQWAERFPKSQRRKVIENRAALLAYDADPQTTLKFLRDRLDLQFNHQQEARNKTPDLPAKLDQDKVAREVFQAQALRNGDDLDQVSERALEDLVREKVALKPGQVRSLLKRLTRPDVPGLVELIADELKTKESRGFGEFPIHRALLPAQLADLANRIPSLAEDQTFVFAGLRKLAPGADSNPEYNPAERDAYLDRALAYARKLPPVFNSLKASLLYQRLEFDRTRGIYDRVLFIEYLKLPRRIGYMNPKYLDAPAQQRFAVDLNADFTETIRIAPPIHSDEALVRDYFLHIFAAEAKGDDGWQAYTQWVRESWLKPIFAEAMIVNGIGNPETWASLISPIAFQALKERVDVDFAPTNPQFHSPADDVALELFIKNAPKVIVKIYEINTLSYFLTNQRQLNTDLPLDGLVANRELTQDFSDDPASRSPFRRVARTFKFPELKGQRGAWVIEFIGGGKSSRALVRKGQWTLLQQVGPAGDMLTVLDEARQPVPGAVAWLEGRRIVADEKTGRIIVPFTTQPGEKPVILADAAGTFATLTSFNHHPEEYALDAQFNVEREQLLGGKEATIAIRSVVLLHDARLSPGLLKDTRLTITSTTLDGISMTTDVKSPKLEATKDFLHTIHVPERLASLRVELSGMIEKLSEGGKKTRLAKEQSWALNGIDKTARTDAGFLSRFGGDYVFELLGKNGEPLADRQINFNFRHREFSVAVMHSLRTDEKGRVELGKLAGLAFVNASIGSNVSSDWTLDDAARTWPSAIHAQAGDAIEVPWTGDAPPGRVSLLEVRAGTFVADRSDAVTPPLKGAGNQATPAFFTLKNLPPGDYSLRLDDQTFEIRIAEGKEVQNWVVSPIRELEVLNAKPLNIDSVANDGGFLVVQLANVGKATRVHVAATRFLEDENLFNELGGFARFEPTRSIPARFPSLYAAGREIGDEYRYILERRYAKLFPGNMLPRPGLLLNPWDVRSTDVQALEMAAAQQAMATDGGRARKAPAAHPSQPETLLRRGGNPGKEGADIDFLATAAPVLYNLVPDEKGVVRIDRKALGDRQYIQVFAGDLNNAVWRTLAMPEVPTKFQDLRLARILDPKKAFTQKKEITLLTTGQTLTLSDILTSELETYDSLPAIHSLFATLNGNAVFAKFAWVLEWPKFKDEEKQAKYSESACHELNFFLSRKDPDFFKKVVQPYLRNKKEKTFMDDYLVENDLRPYLEPIAFARLNMAERALLGQRVPGDQAGIARHLRERWELLPPDPEKQNLLFETGLRGRALQGGGAAGGEFKNDKARSGRENAPMDGIALDAATPAPSATASRGSESAKNGRPEEKMKELQQMQKQADKLEKAEESLAMAQDEDRQSDGKDQAGKKRALIKSENEQLGYDGAFAREEATRLRGLVRQFYRALGPTMEWAENNYYRLPIAQQDASLIPINAFWRDFAAWDGKVPFLSKHIAEAARNFSEMMLALAVTDLPFEAPKNVTRSDAGQFTLTAGGPTIVFHQEIKPAAPAEGNVELLVSQNFYRHGDRYREEGNEKFDKYVTGEFLAGVVYGANIVVTNPASSPQKLNVLMQIPRGALPVLGSKATESKEVRLNPYTTQTFAYAFYFPAPGKEPFPQYPVNVARNEQAAGAAKPVVFNVVKQLSEVDKTSWAYISQYGTEEDVFAFLEKKNIERLDLGRVAWRARQSADFFRKLIGVLSARHIYSDVIWSYSVVHNDAAALGEWLLHQDGFIAQCGPWLETKILTIDPIERRAYQHLEYSPLVNQRTYRLGAEWSIANPVLLGQYQALLNILAYKATLDAMDEMSVVYYLFLQDRVEQALARFQGIQPAALPTKIQHDYFRCYAAFYEEQLAAARGISNGYADYPVDRWRKIFAEVGTQLDEIEGKAIPPAKADGEKDRVMQQAELAATEPSFDFKVENRQITLTWKNLSEVTVNYYLMDPEFLFSSSPFVTQDPARFSIIKPTKSAVVKLPADKDSLDIPLPGEFAKANVLIEILGAGQRKAQAYHSNTLNLTLAENYGRLELRDMNAGKPVSKAYVKVYARLKNGTIRFFKDGHTDLRGKFDYASLNSSGMRALQAQSLDRARPAPGGSMSYQMLKPDELDSVEKLSILIMSTGHGTLIREANPPAE